MLSARITTSIWKFVNLCAVDATLISEEQQPVVRACNKEVIDNIILLKGGAFYSSASTAL
jgi:hypothetical protein